MYRETQDLPHASSGDDPALAGEPTLDFSYEEWVASLVETVMAGERLPGWFDIGQIGAQIRTRHGKTPSIQTLRKRLNAQVEAGALLTARVYDRQKGCMVRVWKPKEPASPPNKAE